MSRTVIGVTGNIASGKSTVARLLQERGCALVDADRVAHELYAENRSLVTQIAAEFGPEVLNADGHLNRVRLGSLVFGKPEALANLNRIVHPVLVANIRDRLLASLRVMNRAVLDAALIVELGVADEMDFLVLVSASPEARLARLLERSSLSPEEARRRLDSQVPEEAKLPYADFVIKNETTLAYLEEQVDALWEEIEAREGGRA